MNDDFLPVTARLSHSCYYPELPDGFVLESSILGEGQFRPVSIIRANGMVQEGQWGTRALFMRAEQKCQKLLRLRGGGGDGYNQQQPVPPRCHGTACTYA
ncbi:hypothetical protein EYF80_019571 [Liparis tanakae]|uniref:Uncharacterized protein n=1 Tax=Liparis tanakae TaxID=230148 RepID=A0A4Z2HXD3_9TELE|nr:hypothetical protein EYF80_019571 [Liparis tanakae]